MIMKKTILFLFALMALFTQCKKDEPNDDNNIVDNSKKVEIDVHADILNWKYFSFEQNAEVGVANFGDTLSWDLGIHYENFRTNGGKSGKGQGAVIDLGEVDFNSVTINSIGANTFTEDDTIQVIQSMSMPPVMVKVPGSVLLEAVFKSPTGPTDQTYAPNNHVYIIKTAGGRHVKFIGTSFFNDAAVKGYLNFTYEFLD